MKPVTPTDEAACGVEYSDPAQLEAIIPRPKWYKLLALADIPQPVGLDGKPKKARI
jgi:hypothetical protein